MFWCQGCCFDARVRVPQRQRDHFLGCCRYGPRSYAKRQRERAERAEGRADEDTSDGGGGGGGADAMAQKEIGPEGVCGLRLPSASVSVGTWFHGVVCLCADAKAPGMDSCQDRILVCPPFPLSSRTSP